MQTYCNILYYTLAGCSRGHKLQKSLSSHIFKLLLFYNFICFHKCSGLILENNCLNVKVFRWIWNHNVFKKSDQGTMTSRTSIWLKMVHFQYPPPNKIMHIFEYFGLLKFWLIFLKMSHKWHIWICVTRGQMIKMALISKKCKIILFYVI